MTAFLALVQVVAVQVLPDVDPKAIATIIGALGLFLGSVIAVIAGQPPTVNSGDTVNVITPPGQDNKQVTVA